MQASQTIHCGYETPERSAPGYSRVPAIKPSGIQLRFFWGDDTKVSELYFDRKTELLLDSSAVGTDDTKIYHKATIRKAVGDGRASLDEEREVRPTLLTKVSRSWIPSNS